MKNDQKNTTNPNTQPVRSPHFPSIANVQQSPSDTFARKRETPRIPSRVFPHFAGITYYCVRSPLAPRIAMLRFCDALIALLFIVFPLHYFFPVDPETAGDPQYDYGVDDPSFLPKQPGKPPLDHQLSPIPSLYCLH